MPETFPFHEISPWVAPPDDLQPRLEDTVDSDVVIIGGGYTGLSTALHLREQGASVTILEQGFAGSGASGRNAGHLTPTIGKDIPTLLRVFGDARTRRLLDFADRAVEFTEARIHELGIDCDYVAAGNLLAGVHPKHEDRLRKAADAAARLGAHVEFLDSGSLRDRGVPPSFHCGILEQLGGHLHPGRYVMGLRRAALDAGVRLYEDSRLVDLQAGGRVVARTAAGAATADHAVLATNAYTSATGWKRRSVAPLRVQLFETTPLDDAMLDDIGWPGREGVYTAHEVLESYRLTAQRSIVGGSRIVRAGFGEGLPPAYDPRAFRAIERAFRQRFPSLGELPIASFWGGWIGLSLDFLPTLGSDAEHENVHFGIGFAGHGVAQATLMGAMLAARVQGKAHELEAALERRSFRWPPEPLRWVAGKLVITALEALDRRTDHQIDRQIDAQRQGP